MKLIETKTLASTATSIEFTSIPQTFTDLMFVCSFRANNAGIPNDTTFLLNGSSPSGVLLYGAGTGAGPSSGIIAISNGNNSTSNTFSNFSVYIPNYTTATTKQLSVDSVMENNGAESYQNINSASVSASAITTFRFTPQFSASYMVGSTVSLYGILKGSDGIVTTS